jgi:Tfp pilus assembly protein PilE
MKLKRRFLTLMEIMVVILLIMMITGVIAYNYGGSLEEGKAFKTKAAIEKVETILNLAIAQNPSLAQDIDSEWVQVISQSRLVQNPDALIYDGWGQKLSVENEDGKVVVYSKKLEEYQRKNGSLIKK